MPYQDLKSFQQSAIVYDFTTEFCKKYIDKKSRTYDQMVQAARSGKQNITEGVAVGKTKPAQEIFLLRVAYGSLKELLEDYLDFLRQNNFILWSKDSSMANEVRKLAYEPDRSFKLYQPYLKNSEKAANAMICLINQTTYLLDQQIKAISEQNGGEINLKKVLFLEKKKQQEFDKKLKEILEGKRKSLDD